jgi:two-component system cell cycle response regulator DivK
MTMNRLSKTILIVDDDSKNIFALAATLRSRGFKIFTASSAEEAIILLQAEPTIGIVLTDMMMPGADGYDFIRMIRQNSHLDHIPVIAVTAQAMPGDREKCIEAGANDYLSKPIDVDKLMDILYKYKIAGSETADK